jgi:hypothetical protein
LAEVVGRVYDTFDVAMDERVDSYDDHHDDHEEQEKAAAHVGAVALVVLLEDGFVLVIVGRRAAAQDVRFSWCTRIVFFSLLWLFLLRASPTGYPPSPRH